MLSKQTCRYNVLKFVVVATV